MWVDLGAPQLILLGIYAWNLVYAAVHHGQPRDDAYSAWVTLAAVAFNVTVLAWGGFFS